MALLVVDRSGDQFSFAVTSPVRAPSQINVWNRLNAAIKQVAGAWTG